MSGRAVLPAALFICSAAHSVLLNSRESRAVLHNDVKRECCPGFYITGMFIWFAIILYNIIYIILYIIIMPFWFYLEFVMGS